MYYIEHNSDRDGVSKMNIKVKQYTQCNGVNHLTDKTKDVMYFKTKPEAIRHLTELIASALQRTNTEVLNAKYGTARIHYAYTNTKETVVYTVKSA